MLNIRRIYIHIVSAVSLNATVWALIALLRNLLTPGIRATYDSIAYSKETMALQLAVIIIGLPVYLSHWLWSERLAAREEREQQATLRLFYLYAIQSAFLIPFIVNAYAFMQSAMRLLLNVEYQIPSWRSELPDGANLVNTAIAMIVLALIWGYHHQVVRANRRVMSETAVFDTIRRLYMYTFSFVGLVMGSTGMGNLLRWLMFQFDKAGRIAVDEADLAIGLAQLLVGIPLWLAFWLQAEKRFNQGDLAEQASALRKFYLYSVIFLAALGTVGSLTTLLASIFRRLFGLESQGDVRNVLCVLITTTVIWAYHFITLQRDMGTMPEKPKQAGVRRLYWYLIAGIGLMALLTGIGGDIGALIQLLTTQNEYIRNDLPEMVSWFTAIAIAGLIMWVVPWKKIQDELLADEPIGVRAHRSWARRLYLYFYLLLATLTFLGTVIYILSQVVLLAMGGRTSAMIASEIAHAIAYGLMATAVWVFHVALIRQDGKALQTVKSAMAQDAIVAVVDDGNGRFAQILTAALQQAIPALTVHSISLTPQSVKEGSETEAYLMIKQVLATAQLIIGHWTIVTPYAGNEKSDLDMIALISNSPAQKLLIPKSEEKWNWIGVDEWSEETAVKQTVRTVKQLVE